MAVKPDCENNLFDFFMLFSWIIFVRVNIAAWLLISRNMLFASVYFRELLLHTVNSGIIVITVNPAQMGRNSHIPRIQLTIAILPTVKFLE